MSASCNLLSNAMKQAGSSPLASNGGQISGIQFQSADQHPDHTAFLLAASGIPPGSIQRLVDPTGNNKPQDGRESARDKCNVVDYRDVVSGGSSGTLMAGLSLVKDHCAVKQDSATNIPDDSKVLANPKGIIKSYLPQAAAMDGQKFAAYRGLCLEHIDEYYKHQKGGIWAVCRVCNNTYRHWNTLQRHLQSHIDFRPFVCDTCGRTFYSQSKLKRHQVIHSDIKPYQCPLCERRLGRTEHLKRHLLVHTDAKPYGCSGCAHTTKRLDGIRRHIKRKHGAGGAEIVGLTPAAESQTLASLRQSILDAARDTTTEDPPKPKAKSKKKKKKKPAAQQAADNNDAAETTQKDAGGILMDVAARFGLGDLRMSAVPDAGRYFDEAAQNALDSTKQYQNRTAGVSGGAGGLIGQQHTPQMSDDIKPSWDSSGMLLPTQFLYQSLARAHHPSALHQQVSVGGGGASTSGISANGTTTTSMPQPQVFSPNRHAIQLQPSAEHGFLMNSSGGVPMRYIPSSIGDGGAAARGGLNHMIFAQQVGAANAGIAAHFPSNESDMIQYIQSQQRFAPPVWGIANPNFQNF